MRVEGIDRRLSQISTHWSLVFRAHAPAGQARTDAQGELLLHYSGAIYRYLLAAVRDVQTAEDLCQEFAGRFVRGDFHRANPEQGRFRAFVKTAVAHLIADHRRRQQARPQPGALDSALQETVSSPEGTAAEKFEELWRQELFERAWEGLERIQEEKGGHLYTVLRLRASEPELSATEMAQRLEQELGRPMTIDAVRQNLHRARERYSDLLLDEVARSLEREPPEVLRAEVSELGLDLYCRDALKRRGL